MKPLLTAISSHRPHRESGEYAANQLLALRSWLPVFEKAVYVGEDEPELVTHKTSFVKGEPYIKLLTQLASQSTTPLVAILNADIIVGKHLIQVAELMVANKVRCATSRRWTFNPGEDYVKHGKLVDNGFDIFVATPQLWREVCGRVPADYKLGQIVWDSWMLGYFNHTHKREFRDFTSYKCVFHPNHGGRKHMSAMPMNSSYLKFAALPMNKL